VLVITADVHERASRVPQILKARGAQVELQALTRGDYVVGPETIVERKTVADFHGSIAAGRLWHQMRKLGPGGIRPYLVIEGDSIFGGAVTPDSVRGVCLALTDLGVAIIRTENALDTAAWLHQLATRRRDGATRDRPVYAQRKRSPDMMPAEAALSSVPGVSTVTARLLLARFGTLRAICDAEVHDLQCVPGGGPARAEAIFSLIRNQWRADGPD